MRKAGNRPEGATDSVTMNSKRIGSRAGLVFSLSIQSMLFGCMGPRLPPPAELESGCHVWYEPSEGIGISASASDTHAILEANGGSVDGPSFSEPGVIAFNEKEFAYFDGDTLLIEKLNPFAAEYSGRISRDSTTIVLEGGHTPLSLRRSAACTPDEAALGATAVYLALFESERQSRIAVSGASGERREAEPRRPSRITPTSGRR